MGQGQLWNWSYVDLVWGLCWLGSRSGEHSKKKQKQDEQRSKSSHETCYKEHTIPFGKTSNGKTRVHVNEHWGPARNRAEGEWAPGWYGAIWGCKQKFTSQRVGWSYWCSFPYLLCCFHLYLSSVVVVVRLEPTVLEIKVPEMNKWCNFVIPIEHNLEFKRVQHCMGCRILQMRGITAIFTTPELRGYPNNTSHW